MAEINFIFKEKELMDKIYELKFQLNDAFNKAQLNINQAQIKINQDVHEQIGLLIDEVERLGKENQKLNSRVEELEKKLNSVKMAI
jgi:uncharacterized protein YlxW (UPF0749 family)